MADEPGNTPKGNGEGAAAGGGGSAPAAPSINVLLQYVKDLSFENPGAPQALIPQKSPPKIEIGVNVDATTLGSDNFEVEIGINANGTAQAEGESEGSTPPAVFAVELRYAGVFRIQNVPQESLHAVVLIECPRILFPFARQVIADATRNGGFPPLMIDPIDFAALYRQRLERAAAAQESAKSKEQADG
ncbi:MAG: protein-export chaperone SecB [Hyphomicrobiales bacterium]|nr:protein-export chaperone SecB [Hyphomicrobiales bacterium]